MTTRNTMMAMRDLQTVQWANPALCREGFDILDAVREMIGAIQSQHMRDFAMLNCSKPDTSIINIAL